VIQGRKELPRSTRQSRKRFRERLRQWRRKRGFTQEELAKRAEVPTISVSHFETGHRFPNAESLRRLADALGVSADYLLGRVKNPVGKDIVASDPEVVALSRRFQGMSQQARDQVKELFQIVDATDKKTRERQRKKK
jgi:transcriptional regulator with XRE-family HTH domain